MVNLLKKILDHFKIKKLKYNGKSFFNLFFNYWSKGNEIFLKLFI